MYGSFDRTFCTGERCNRREKCDRWLEHLKRYVARKGIDVEGRPISVASFADHEGKCERYSPIDEAVESSRGDA